MRKILSLAIVSILCISAAFAQIPAGYVSLYDVLSQAERAPISVSAVGSQQVLGPGSGWDSPLYDVSNYGKLVIKVTFDAADAGKQAGVRFYAENAVQKMVFTYPSEGTTYEVEINPINYAVGGRVRLGGIVFYNGATHWDGISYTDAATQAATINYIALEIVQPTAIDVVPVNATLAQALPVGQTTTLQAQLIPVNTTNKAVTWSSATPGIATVDAATGEVTGVAAGNVDIIATSTTSPLVTGYYNVKVASVNTPVTGVTMTSSSIDLKMLNTATLAYTIEPVTANNTAVTWESSNTSVATVNATSGVITPVSAGTATITVKTEDGNFTDDCTVNVIGYEPIPAGYVSLYTLDFNVDGGTVSLSTTHGASFSLPAIITNNPSEPITYSLLGTGSNWNRNDRYVDLADYDEVEVACYFQTEHIGKTMEFRYCFSGATSNSDATPPVNRSVTIESNIQKFKINLTNDAADIAGLRRLGAIKFRNTTSGGIFSFNVDYVALKPTPELGPGMSIQSVEQNNDPVVAIKYYNLQGIEMHQAPEGGICIVKKIHASSKVSVEKIAIK